jgi:hypothetical protein
MFLRGACPIHNPEKSAEAGTLYGTVAIHPISAHLLTNTAMAFLLRSSLAD